MISQIIMVELPNIILVWLFLSLGQKTKKNIRIPRNLAKFFFCLQEKKIPEMGLKNKNSLIST